MVDEDFVLVHDVAALRKRLTRNLLENAAFIHKVFESDQQFVCYVDREENVSVAIQEDRENVLFAGEWADFRLPLELLPDKGFFTAACPSGAMAQLRIRFQIKEEWPCWRYIAPDGYGSGPWDELDRLTPEDVPFISRYWDLLEDSEPYLRERISRYESACIRVSGKPVSWGGLHFEIKGMGEMGFAYTLEVERRKGYGSLVTKALVNRVIGHGNKAFCHMFKTNLESIALCERLGFSRDGDATWALIGAKLE